MYVVYYLDESSLIADSQREAGLLSDVPIDARHILAKLKKQKKGDHVPSRIFHRPSIRDFPQEWLPQP
jgi:small subunit ribosomal protein S35